MKELVRIVSKYDQPLPKPAPRGKKAPKRIARKIRPLSKAKIVSMTRAMHRKAWKAWSVFVRRSGADSAGLTECYTCRRLYPWQDMHAGHYRHGVLDFDSLNIHAQCVRCNRHLHGALDEYYIRLVQDHGAEAVEALRARASRYTRYTLAELEEFWLRYRDG